MNEIVLPSSGKVNIGLQVLNKRPDGFHNIHTIFQELRFPDTITLRKRDSGNSVTCNDPNVPLDKSNICIKALLLLQKKFPEMGGVDIDINKSIPPGSGLGGGSANAAATLTGLNQLYSLNLSEAELEAAGASLGADVPFFIKGGTQIGEGIGERLKKIDRPISGFYLLVIPEISINTAWAYGCLKNSLEPNRKARNFASLLSEKTDSLAVFENDFENVVIPAHPEIGVIKNELREAGAKYSSLSGSGSTVYGIFDEEASAQEAESSLNSLYKTVLTTPANI